MKTLRTLLTWGLLSAAAHVMGYSLTVSPIEIEAGQSTNLIINLDDAPDNFTAYQMMVYLPDGVTVQKKTNGKYAYTANADRHDGAFTVTVKDAADGSVLIACFSADKDVLTGTSGELICLPLEVASTVTTSLQGSIKNIEFSDVNNNAYNPADVNFTMTMKGGSTSQNITFEDAAVKAICVANWDTNHDGELSEAEAAAVTDLGEVFRGNTTITSFNELQYFSGLTTIGDNAFLGSTALTSVTIPDGVTTIGNSAFRGSGLETITFPNSLTSILWDAFDWCMALTSITIPKSVTRIDASTFQGCQGLTSIIVEEGNPTYDSRDNCNAIIETATNTLIAGCQNTIIPESVTSIGGCAFEGGCTGPTTFINIPEGVTSIWAWGFHGCGLTSVTIPNSVTLIDHNAFQSCDIMTDLTIGSGVTNIRNSAFSYCSALTDVWCNAENVPTTENDAFNNSPIASATLHVPAASMEAYSNTAPWSGFGSIVAIGDDVEKEEQTLSLASLPEMTEGGSAYTLPQQTNQGLTLTWNIEDATIASINGYQLTPLKAGTTTVTATQAGNSSYKPFTKPFTLTVADKSLLNNRLYAETVSMRTGTSKTISLKLDNTLTFIACEFYLQLPEGVRIETDEDDYLMAELVSDRINRHSLEVDHVGNGLYHFLCYSNKNYAFKGQSGDFITITVACDEGLVADTYTAIVKDIIFSDQDKHQVDLLDSDFDIIVTDIIPGDANGDEKINVMDIVEIVGHIMGNPSDTFVFTAADMDENGTINVMDLVNVVSLIMTNTSQQAASAPRRRFAAPMRANTTTDALTVADFSIAAGETKEVSMVLDNPTNEFIAFEFWMSLPDGVRIAYDEEGELMATLNASRSDGHDFIVEEPNGDGIYHFLCYSGRNKRLKGNSGELINLTLTCAGDATVGNATGTIYDMIFSDPDKNEVNLADATFSVAITEAGDGRTVLDENSTTVPAAATNVDVRVKRTIKANEWSTICLPFAMTEAQVKEAFGNDVQLGDFVGAESEFDEADNVTGIAVSFDEASAIEANHPYVIKVSQPVEEFTVDGVNINADEDEAYFEFDNGKSGSRRVVYSGFYGTYHAGTVLDEFTLFLNDNKFWYSTGQTKMKAFRAYFAFLDVLTNVENAADVIEFKMNLDDATGIEMVNGQWSMVNEIYNLAGQRVGDGYKGIVVTKGKKFIK